MTDMEPISKPRRDFLRGAALAVGAVTIGLDASQSQAASPMAPALDAPALSVAYWTGTRLIDARRLPTGDQALYLSGARLLVPGHGGGEDLKAINAHYPVAIGGEAHHVPFHAWTSAAHGNSNARFLMPVTSAEGILLSALHEHSETFCRLRTDAAPGQPKLRTGLYVLALGQPDWRGLCLDPDALRSASGPLTRRTLSGFVPARFGYRVFSVEPA